MGMQKVVGLKSLQDKLKRLADAVAADALERALIAGALVIRNEAERNAPKRTRTLARSISVETVEKSPERATVKIGTNLEYAAIHEFGGTIYPKNGKFLAVPISAEARQFVEPKNYPGKLHAVMGSATSGVLLDDDNDAQFALVTSVTIPARPYLRPAFDTQRENATGVVVEALRQLIQEASR